MNPDELAHLLTSMEAAHTLAEAVRCPDLQAVKGWNLTRWRCDEAPEAVRFVHHDPRGKPDTALLCVNSPGDCEWVYETTLRLATCPTRLLVLNK
jgi:hypothetical protein